MKPRTYTYRIGAWAGYVAGVWAFVFAAGSAYWAAGGILGLDAVSPEIVVLSENSWFVPLLWGVVVAKVLLGLLALALVQSWGRLVPGWILLTAAWGAGGLMVLHGGSNLLVRGLMAVGVIVTPQSMHSTTAFWYLVFWDPWFLVGGILFCVAAWHYWRTARESNAGAASGRGSDARPPAWD